MAGRFSIDAVFNAVDHITAPVRKMERSVNSLANRMKKSFSGLANSLEPVRKGLDRISKAAQRMGGSARTAKEMFSSMTEKARGWGTAVAVGGSAGIVAALTKIVTLGADYELMITKTVAKSLGGLDTSKGMDKAKVQAGYYDKMSKDVRDMARNSQFTALQVASAAHFWAKTGIDLKKIAEYTEITLEASVAMGTPLEDTADQISDMIGGAGVKTKAELKKFVDQLVKTTMLANMDLTDAFEAFKQAGALSTVIGTSTADLLGGIATLASGGIKGEQSGTHFKNIFTRMSTQTNAASVSFSKLGVKLKDGKGHLRNYLDILEDLEASLANVTAKRGNKESISHIVAMFGKIPLPSVMLLLQKGIAESKKNSKRIADSLGYSAALKRIFGETVGGAIAGVISAIEDISIGIFEENKVKIQEIFKDMSAEIRKHGPEVIQYLGTGLRYIVDNYIEIAHWISKVAIGIGVFVSLSVAMGLVANMLTIISVLASMNIFGLIIISIGLLVAAFYYLYNYSDQIFKGLEEIWNSFPYFVKAAFVAIGSLVATFLLTTGPIGLIIGAATLIAIHWKKLGAFFTGLFQGIISTFDWAANKIGEYAEKINSNLNVFNIKKNLMGGLINQFQTQTAGVAPPQNRRGGRGSGSPRMVSPAARNAAAISNNQTTTNNNVLTIKDQTGRAKLSGNKNKNINMSRSGGF